MSVLSVRTLKKPCAARAEAGSTLQKSVGHVSYSVGLPGGDDLIRHDGAYLRARGEGALENGDDFGERGRHLEYGEGTDGVLFVNEAASLMKTPDG